MKSASKRIRCKRTLRHHIRKEIRKILNEPEPKPRLEYVLYRVNQFFNYTPEQLDKLNPDNSQ